MKSQEARNQRDRSQTRKEEERKMREEVEERLRSENLGVESILQDDNDDCLTRREQIKINMRPIINHLFKCNLEEINVKTT